MSSCDVTRQTAPSGVGPDGERRQFAEEPDRFQAAVQSFLAMWPSDRGAAACSGAAWGRST